MSIKTAAITGFANASSYDKHRPSYPADGIFQLLSHLHIAGVKNARIIDLAAGTGKCTQVLAAREEEYEIVAVEPHEGMRAELDKKGLKGVEVRDGTAESMRGIEGQSVDAVIAGQAWHWFSNQDSLKEIYRVLAPGAGFGMIWNIEDYNAPQDWTPSTEWERKLKELTWTCEDDTPRFRHMKWKQTFEDQLKSSPLTIQSADPLFSLPIGEASVKFETWLTREGIWDRYHTLSQIAILEGPKLEKVKTVVMNALDGAETNEKGEIAVHGNTYFAWASAIPGAPLRSGG